MNIFWKILLLLVILASDVWAAPGELVEIKAIVKNGTPNQGNLLGRLFNSENSYMQDAISQAETTIDENGAAILIFGKHPKGKYAVVVFDDSNGNLKLDTNFFGKPTEKIGFSNNAKGIFGPAKWVDALFDATSDIQIEINLE